MTSQLQLFYLALATAQYTSTEIVSSILNQKVSVYQFVGNNCINFPLISVINDTTTSLPLYKTVPNIAVDTK